MAKKEDGDMRRHMDPATRQTQRQGSDRSPMHPQARHNRTASPAWEKQEKKAGEGGVGVGGGAGTTFAPSTPGRSRLRTNSKPDEPTEKGPPLPKFGQWDPNDPSSADGFTVIFNKARDEKRAGGAVQPRAQSPENDHDKHQRSSSGKWYCCFGGGET